MQFEVTGMNKKALWDKFIRTGKVSDYLRYRKAEHSDEDYDTSELEAAEELFPDCPNGEDYNYDNQHGRYSDT